MGTRYTGNTTLATSKLTRNRIVVNNNDAIETRGNYTQGELAAYRRINRLKESLERMRWFAIFITIVLSVAVLISVYVFGKYGVVSLQYSRELSTLKSTIKGLEKGIEDRDAIIAQKNEDFEDYKHDITFMVTEYNKLYNDYSAMSDMYIALDAENKEIIDKYNSDNEELDTLRRRRELYDKYDYAFNNYLDEELPDDQRRTEITYDQVEMLERLAEEYGLSDDAVALILAIAMNESRGEEYAKNPYSTAAGYCGILNTTGKFLYENIMGNPVGSYYHDLAYDGYVNFEMAMAYINYMNDMYGGDIDKIIAEYRGEDDTAYIDNLNKSLGRIGKSLYTLNLSGGGKDESVSQSG